MVWLLASFAQRHIRIISTYCVSIHVAGEADLYIEKLSFVGLEFFGLNLEEKCVEININLLHNRFLIVADMEQSTFRLEFTPVGLVRIRDFNLFSLIIFLPLDCTNVFSYEFLETKLYLVLRWIEHLV